MVHSQKLNASDLSLSCGLSRRTGRTAFWLASVLVCALTTVQALAQPPAGPDTGKTPVNTNQEKDTGKKEAGKKDTGKKKPGPQQQKVTPAADKQAALKKEEPEKPKQPARPNPVQQLIRGIFQGRGLPGIGGPKPARPRLIKPGDNPENAVEEADRNDDGSIALDSIDRRAPVANRQTAIYERGLRAAENEEWPLVIEIVEILFNPRSFPHDTLVRRKDGSLVSIRREAIALLGRVPLEHREVYVREFSAAAERLLHDAVEDGNITGLVEVASRYFWTPSGPRAADFLATRHLDRGEFTIAAQWLELLLEAESPVTETAIWKRKAAVAFHMAGREDLTDRLGADKITPGNWGQRLSTTQPRQMNEWPMLFGNSRRFTVGTGSPPVLLKRWSVPTSWNRSLARKIDDMIDGFTDANHPTLPVAMPLLVNGKVICRTFRGVQVADAATGRLLWSTDGQDSVEAMLSGQLDNPQLKMAWNGNPRAFLQQSSTANKTGGPLGQLIFQNAAHGLLSCDGERLYVIEDSPVFTLSRTSIRFRNNQSTVALDGNRLKAYDLETGRPLWEAGGPVSIEEFALPLSGHFFMGPPVADGGDLFVMTESDSEIRLQALDPQTGHPKWSQPIAYAERRIGQDLNRRMWSTHLAVADGTVICPTTVGWLVAVDRTRRSVQWAFRYAPRKKTAERGRRRFSSSQIPAEEINTRWLVSAPIVRGDRLFFTPPEATDEQNRTTGTLVCIELSSGKRLWQRPKTTHLYLAGVLEDRAILVAPDSVKALSLSGKLLWECSFGSDSVPSGRGVTINGILYQPMQRNELIGIHLETGKVVSRQQMPFGERPLGNLLTYRGMLISHHPAEITAWEQKEALDHQLAEIRDQSLDDIDSLLLEAKASTTEGDFDHALSLLDQVSSRESYSTSEDVRQRVDHLVRRVIVSRIRRTPGERPELHDRLQQLAWSPREEAENHQLKFVTLSATDQYSKAFDVLMQLAVLPGEMSFVRADNQRVNAAQDAWLRGQMLDVWAHLSAEEQAQASARLRKIAGQAETDDARRRLARLLAFHPATEPLRHDFARSAVKSGRLHEATGWLMESRWTEKLPEIASLFVQLIEDYQQAGDSLVPIQIATRWRETLSHQPLPDGRSIDELLTQVQDPKRVSRGVDASDWGEFDLNLTRTATSYSYRTARTLNPRSGHRTVCDGLRIEWVQHSYGSVTQRINFINESDGSLYWSVPIRSGTSGPAVYRHFHLGATMVVFSQGVLNCLSIPERRVVWTQLVGTPDNGTSTLKRSFRPMSQGTSFLNEIPGRASMGSGPIPVVNSRYICYRARRRLTILNTQTGAVQWTIRGIPAGTRVFGTLSELYVLPSNGHGDYALRAIDGKQIPHDNIRSILMTALLMKDNLIVTTTLKKGTSRTLLKGLDTGAQIRIQARNFGTDQVLWQQSFPATSQFRGSADDELAILSSDGKLQLLDLLTGHLKELGSLPEISAKRPQAFVLADRSHVYIVLNSQSRSRSYYGDLQTIQASHDIVAFDRQDGKQVWHQKVGTSQANAQRSQSLVVTDLDRNPVMILISSSYEQKLQTQLVKIRVLDKKTGKTLTDYAAPGYPGYRTLKIDLQRRYIDLISYQDRIRLTALTKPAAADGQPVTADSR